MSRGWATWTSLIWAGLAALASLLAEWQDSNPFGFEPETLQVAAAAVVLVMGFGRVLQRIYGEVPVEWDLTSILTFAVMAASALAAFFAEYLNEGVAAGVGAERWMWLSALFAAAFTFFRQVQAAIAGRVAVEPRPSEAVLEE